jgi:hypothetical protein
MNRKKIRAVISIDRAFPGCFEAVHCKNTFKTLHIITAINIKFLPYVICYTKYSHTCLISNTEVPLEFVFQTEDPDPLTFYFFGGTGD